MSIKKITLENGCVLVSELKCTHCNKTIKYLIGTYSGYDCRWEECPDCGRISCHYRSYEVEPGVAVLDGIKIR